VFAAQPRGRIGLDLLAPMLFDHKLARRTGVRQLCGLPDAAALWPVAQ
jgi:hypothetical protein